MSTTLDDLNLSNNNLLSVPFYAISGATKRLKKICLTCTKLKTSQLTDLLSASVTSTTLEDIDLAQNNLSSVSSVVIARAITKLKIINLKFTDLTTSQLTDLLTASVTSTTLENINLIG